LFEQDESRQPAAHDQRVTDLLDRDHCAAYLDRLGAFIGSPSRRATASTLAKRYAFLAVSPVLYAMTVLDKGIAFPPAQCILSSDTEPDAPTRLPRLGLASVPTATTALHGQREEWRASVLGALFAGHLSPLIGILAETARVSKTILWENALVRIVPIFEEALELTDGEAAACRIRGDWRYIVYESAGELFGERRNPLSGLAGPEDQVYGQIYRRTCCLYYEVCAEYCRACPLPQHQA